MENTPEAYGPHLTIDAYGCPAEKLASLDLIFSFLDKLPGIINMEKITKPYVFKHLESPDPEWGITGVVIIATSHISVHSYPKRGVCFADVFSCKDFDTKKARDYFEEMFAPKTMDVSEVKRGIHFHETLTGGW
jgi:S-adenosylmethionine decarboxylase